MIKYRPKERFVMSITPQQLKLALTLRMRQFEKETHLKCNLDLMSEAYHKIIWKNEKPEPLSVAIDSIFSVNNEQLIQAFLQLEEKVNVHHLLQKALSI